MSEGLRASLYHKPNANLCFRVRLHKWSLMVSILLERRGGKKKKRKKKKD